MLSKIKEKEFHNFIFIKTKLMIRLTQFFKKKFQVLKFRQFRNEQKKYHIMNV